jgi:hypothetical protein
MDLNLVASPVVAAVLPPMPVTIQVSAGSTTNPDGTRTPVYETPGVIISSITAGVLTVFGVNGGYLRAGQIISDLDNIVAPRTLITGQLTGTTGGIGTYQTSNEAQAVSIREMKTSLVLPGSVQPMTWRDLQQLDGLNIEGVRWKIYLHGQVDGIVRPEKKGGDLVDIPSGPHAGVWLVAQVLEQFPNWVCAAITLQNGG